MPSSALPLVYAAGGAGGLVSGDLLAALLGSLVLAYVVLRWRAGRHRSAQRGSQGAASTYPVPAKTSKWRWQPVE